MNTKNKGQSPQKTQINVNAFKQIYKCDTLKANHLTERNTIEIEVYDYETLGVQMLTLFETIEVIANSCDILENDKQSSISLLAKIGKSFVPISELDFLDRLLLKNNLSYETTKFMKVEDFEVFTKED